MRGATVDSIQRTRKNTKHDTLLTIIDILLSALIIGPAVVAYWRGTWILMDLYLFPDDPHHSAWVSLVVGQSGHFLLTLLQQPMVKRFHPNEHRLTYYVTSRFYTSFFAVVCVNAWRGAWAALDLYTGKQLASVIGTTLLSVVALVFMRALRNLSAPPFAVATDVVDGYFDIPTMFRLTKSRDGSLYVLDILFSVIIVGNLVVFVWRGAWTLVDILLFPEDEALSAWASLILGYSDFLLVFALQPLLMKACERTSGLWRLLIADLYLLLSFFGTINVWRGVWNLLNVYFLPEAPFLNNWLTHGLSLILLILMNCSNSILVRGVFIDGEEEGGQCVLFPCSYLRVFVQSERDARLANNAGKHHSPSRRKNDADIKCLNIQEQQSNNTASNHVHLHLLPTTTSSAPPEDAEDVIQ